METDGFTTNAITYEYNASGLRTEKTVDGETTKYYYNDSQLLGEERDGAKLYYYYDDGGQIIGLNYNGVNYYVLRNLQGDVVALTDKNGTKVVSYVYDSWGQVISVTGSLKDTLGKDNPFRYRGYYYDEESGFYYLQSRYYDPETCRFLNADAVTGVVGDSRNCNMFVYCSNNPIGLKDPSGYIALVDDAIILFVVGMFALISVSAIAVAVDNTTTMLPPITWDNPDVTVPRIKVPNPYLAKKSRQSGKEKSTDKPSWVNKDMLDMSQSPQQNARRILDNKYGSGNWKSGPGSEYNKIVKWISRNIIPNLSYLDIIHFGRRVDYPQWGYSLIYAYGYTYHYMDGILSPLEGE